jgi:hypothetical protein
MRRENHAFLRIEKQAGHPWILPQFGCRIGACEAARAGEFQHGGLQMQRHSYLI